MRRVRVFKIEWGPREQGRPSKQKVPDGEATFHQWGSAYEEFEAGPGNYSTAIIERQDGTIEAVSPELIQFIDPSKTE